MSHPRGTRTERALRYAAVMLGSVVLGPILLAACGSVRAPAAGTAGAAPAKGSGSPSATSAGTGPMQVPLCRDAAAVTSLQIVRIHGLRVPETQTSLPGQFAAIGPAGAQAVARTLCALPTTPHGLLNCPAMFPGTSYQLRFTADGQRFPAVTIEATGCDTVTGAGQARRATSGFWRVLATAAGLSPPGQAAFTGPACQSPPGMPTKINGCPGLSQPVGGAAQPGGVNQPAG
jgi:hypothetical protein